MFHGFRNLVICLSNSFGKVVEISLKDLVRTLGNFILCFPLCPWGLSWQLSCKIFSMLICIGSPIGVVGQGCSHKGVEVLYPFQCLACWHICCISLVLANVVLLIELVESALCQQIWLELSLFVGKLGLCTQPTIFFTFTSAVSTG